MLDERRRTAALAVAYETRLVRGDPEARKRRGAFYTPPELVEWVLDRALGARQARPPERVLDPACGTGHFLVAAAQRLGVRAVHGSDTDPEAVRISRLRLAAEDPSVSEEEIADRIRVADGLTEWTADEFDAVVGNPPFLGQLRRRTAGEAGGLGAYTDTSAVFLHRALDLVRDGGTVAMVQPLSLLGTRDAAPVRAAVAEAGAMTGFWSSAEPVFEGTPVRTCVPVIRRGVVQGPVAAWHGPEFAPDQPVSLPKAEWGGLAAQAFGIPLLDLSSDTGTLGDLADCTADFRDQYYGLVPHVRDGEEGPDHARLVTSGLIEPGASMWGRRTTRFAKQRYDAPVVDLASLRAAGDLTDWAQARLVPKLLVAGQGRVIEAVADPEGAWLPSVPVVSVVPHDPADLWRLLAVTLAPPVVAHAAARYLGTGLTPGSVKVSARQVAALPLPADRASWDEAAEVVRSRGVKGLSDVARLMCTAYGVTDDGVRDWWRDRAL